jgi:bifunctional ADP-heptose synthase (sugar kinase/adenylyltransferase)
VAREIGAEIRIIPFVAGRSTTEIVLRILERYR